MQAAGQAAWARLLSQYTGEISSTFGTTLSGRSVHEDLDEISFPSITTVPVRCNVIGTNKELLTRTMSSTATLHKHQFTPLTSIQKWAGYPEGKIFDTLFAYQKLPEALDHTQSPWIVIQEDASVDYAVSLEVQPIKSHMLNLRLTFREDLIPVNHAELILKQYDELLLDLLFNPKNSCDLPPPVKQNLLSITPAKETSLPGSVALLHEFVEIGARKWPNKVALEFATCLKPENFKSKTWSYQQLDDEANKVAQLLLQRRVKPSQMVAVCFDKCAEASFGIIGILKSGCSYVALDPNAPADRLKFIIQDSGAEVILTAGKPAQNLAAVLDSSIIILDAPGALEGCSASRPELSRTIQPEDTAYCLYTSGTTGAPKGCLISHESVVQFMFTFQRIFAGRWTEDSKWLQFASFHFDVSIVEQFWSWSVGICVASAPRDLIFEDISGAIRQLGITHLDLTPSLARTLNPDDVPSLWNGVFITGGEQLKQEILDAFGKHGCIHNAYGPTEATIGVTMYPQVPQNGNPSNIGLQFNIVGSYVLKPGTEVPVLRGGIGELCVSGILVGKGYLNRPDLTAEKFPTLHEFNERVYRTGDLVRILHDGSIIFLGRADDQVKLRGQRLELSEINEVIRKSMRKLDEVVTLVLKHAALQKEQLVTFFVASFVGDEAEAASLIPSMKDACKSRLPGYMVPTHFVPIKKLPLNVNNKADSKQLASIYNELSVGHLQALSRSGQRENDWSENEKTVLDIIVNALQVDLSTLSRGSNLFELGLDSISIIGFSRELQNAGLENAKLSVVKSNPGIGAIVQALLNDEPLNQEAEDAYVTASQNITAFSQKHMINVCKELEVSSADVESIAPCTPVQEGMIYRFLQSNQPLYFQSFEFAIDDMVDLHHLSKAWGKAITQLQVLRTKFVSTDDGYAQVALRSSKYDWMGLPVNYATLEKSQALKVPFNLSLAPSHSGNILSIHIFHGLYDGNSLAMLLDRVIDEYRGDRADYGPPFHSSLAYGPLAKISGAKDFWTNHLQNWAYQPLHHSLESLVNVVASKTLKSLSGFEDLRKRIGVAPQAVIQAAWLSTLQTISSDDCTIGIVTSGRAIEFGGVDKVIGPLFNTVPFHVKIEPDMTSASLISVCHEFNMRMQDFQHTPLKDIQKWSPANPGQSLFDTLFVFQRPESEENYAKGVWTQLDNGQVADYPLAFEATLSASGKLDFIIVAQGSVITQSTATNLLDHMERSLRALIENGGKNVILGNEAMADGSSSLTIGIANAKNSTTSLKNEIDEGHFTWTKEAQVLRTELSALADVPEDTIQSTSSIFELGLDSIDVIKLASRLKKQGIDILVSTIIKCQTIAKMIPGLSVEKVVDSKSSGQTIQRMNQDLLTYLKKLGKVPIDMWLVFPATPLQQSMVNEMIKSDYKRYWNVEAFELANDVDIPRLTMAIERVIYSSPILRTSIVEIEDPRSPVSYAQIVHQHPLAAIEVSKEENLEAFVDQFRAKSARSAATYGSLFQVKFLVVGKKRFMAMAISHALYDGTSLRLLHKDIQNAYRMVFTSRPDFVPFLEEIFKSTTEHAKNFWRSTLSNLPPAKFPRKESSMEPTAHRAETRSHVSLKDVEGLCKSLRITLQTIGQTCWAMVLSHLTSQLDVVFGTVLSCRDSEESNEVMFPLMNTVVVRSVLHGNLSVMLRYMQDMSDTTRQYQHFPLGTAQAYALASRDSQLSVNDTTLFDTLFIYQGRRSTQQSNQLYQAVYGAAEVEFPVCVEMEILDDGYISWTTACKSDARNSAETKEIIKMLDGVLERLVATPRGPTIVSDVEGISVCGLPKFRKLDAAPKKFSNPSSEKGDGKWSDTELEIRKALHTISDVPEEQINKNSSIFHLGLDSILILKLPALLRKSGIKLGVSDILRDQTVCAMARSVCINPVQQEALDVDASLSNAISSLSVSKLKEMLEKGVGEVESIYPVTAGQLYTIRQWQGSEGIVFYPTFRYNLVGKLNKQKLENAWRALLKMHPILRTGFVEVGSDMMQVVYRNPDNNIVYGSSNHNSDSSDLSRPPVRLIVESGTNLKLVIHHALYDGISLPILVDQLQSLYQGQTFPSSELDFKTFVAQSISASNRLTTSLESTLTVAKETWASYLTQGSLYPTRMTSKSRHDRTEVFHPSRKILPLKQQAQDTGVSVDSLFLAGISKIYAQRLEKDRLEKDKENRKSQVPHVVFGIYLANRAPFGEDLSSLAAPTLNLLPLCVRDPSNRTIQALAKDIQNDLNQISRAEISSASLAQIYEWTGVRINFFVNIRKDTVAGTIATDTIFEPLQDLSKRAEVVQEVPNENISIPTDGRCDAYLVSLSSSYCLEK